MTTHTSHIMALPSPGDSEQATRAVQAIKTLRDSLMNGGVETYVALADENAKLKEMNEKLKGDMESLTRQIANMVHAVDKRTEETNTTKDELNKLQNRYNTLSNKLSNAQQDLEARQKEIATLEKERAKEVTALKKDLETQSAEYQALRNRSVQLLPVANNKEMM